MKRFLAAAVSAVLFLASAGCGKKEEPFPADSSEVSGFADSMESMLSDLSDESELEDVRAAALSVNAAKMWLLSGGLLAAAVEEAAQLPGAPKDLVKVGTEEKPRIEDILSAKPDVIIADRSAPGYQSVKDALSKADCDVIEVSDNSFEEYDASMKLLTARTGNREAYQKYAADVAVRNEEIIQRALEAAHRIAVTVTQPPADASAVPGDSSAEKVYYAGRIPTFLVIHADEECCRAASNDDYLCSMLRDYGMTNANKSGQQVTVWKKAEDTSSDASLSDASASDKEKKGDVSVSSEAKADQSENTSAARMAPASESVDTFAGDNDTRNSEDAGRRAFENLLANNPDFIFIVYSGDEKAADATCRELARKSEAWEKTYAARSDRVYQLPQQSFGCQPNEHWDMAYEYLYQTIFVL